MKIDSINLVNFRNYENLNLNFNNFLNIIYGSNGSGKTNLIEAIYLLSLTKSFRINNDKNLIRKGMLKAKVVGNVTKDNDTSKYGIEISNEGKVVSINDSKQEKISNYVSQVNVVLFNPADTRLIDEAPQERRKLLNVEISKLYKEYLIVLGNYDKILKQRNFYLRGMYVNANYNTSYLEILTKKLVEYGKVVTKYREEFINSINEFITEIYKKIFGAGELKIKYISTYKGKDTKYLLEKYKKNYQKEMAIGKTLDGVHHDDIAFILDDNNLKEWGSEGQRKNAIIAFKMAELEVIKMRINNYPILILDDLFSELDQQKIDNIFALLKENIQTFITTTDIKDVSDNYLNKAKIIKVDNGMIEEKRKEF